MSDVEAEIAEFRKRITDAQDTWRETVALTEIACELKRLNARLEHADKGAPPCPS
jgi:hypothetical protein